MYPAVSWAAHVPYYVYFIIFTRFAPLRRLRTICCLLPVSPVICHLSFAIVIITVAGHRHHLDPVLQCTRYVMAVLYPTSRKLMLNLPATLHMTTVPYFIHTCNSILASFIVWLLGKSVYCLFEFFSGLIFLPSSIARYWYHFPYPYNSFPLRQLPTPDLSK